MTEDPEKVTIKGHRIELPEGRSVSVGMVDGAPEVYVMMVNREGENTDFKLSPEAAMALHDLLGKFAGNNGWASKVVSA